jgi:glycosyltransferase EpsD
MKWFKEQGWEVHVAARGGLELPYVDRKFDLPFERSPLRRGNLAAYRRLKELVDANEYRIVHGHTPVGGALARLAAREARKNGTHVLYTAHGFHFYDGAPRRNWMLYYPAEYWLAQATDALIAINAEDYRLAVRRGFPAGRIERIHGIGVDLARYRPAEEAAKRALRASFGFDADDVLFAYAAEFNANKNQRILLRAFADAKAAMPRARLLLAGDGAALADCKRLAHALGVADAVDFLGYRDDIEAWLPLCDVAVASSFREGLPINVVEAMACGLPVIASRNRGHNELVADGDNGYLVSPRDPAGFAARMMELYGSKELRARMGRRSRQASEAYGLDRVLGELAGVYMKSMKEDGHASEGQYRRSYL